MTLKGWYKSGDELIQEMKNTVVPSDMMAIWFLGQAGVAVKINTTLFCIDPFLRPGAFRAYEPPFAMEAAGFFDYILCTHNHIDHLDDVTVKALAEAGADTKFVVPTPHTGVMEQLGVKPENIIPAETFKAVELKDAQLLPVPAAHEEFEYDEKGRMTCLGYILKAGCGSLYHGGDTVEWETMVEDLKPLGIDIMCLPINGSDWKRKHRDIIGNLNSREAADVAADCGADLVIPLHFDMFAGNGENPAHFVDYMHYDHPGRKFHIMVPGERFFYCK